MRDIFTDLMGAKAISFPEAVEMIARESGLLEVAIELKVAAGTPKQNCQDMVSKGRAAHQNGRLREAIARAKAEGKYKGRAPTARAKAAEVLRLHREGVGATEIGKRLGISRASVYRCLPATA